MQFFPCSSSVARWPYLHREKSPELGVRKQTHIHPLVRAAHGGTLAGLRGSRREKRDRHYGDERRRRIEHASFAWPTSRGSEAPVDVSNSDCLPVTRTASFDRTFQDANNDKSGGGEGWGGLVRATQ